MTTISKESEPRNCWEFLDCPKEFRNKCEVYIHNFGNTCWFITGNFEKGDYGYNEYGGCFNCPWYKKNNPDWETK